MRTLFAIPSFRKDTAVLFSLALFIVLLHIFVSIFTEYGYFIDEFYYIACTKHLAWGYVDQPPLSIFLLAFNRWVLGDSLPALRFLPALASGAIVFLTGLTAQKLGGGVVGQVLAALAAIVTPGYLVFCGFYSMNPFECILWTGIVYITIRMFQEDKPGLWLLIGLLFGLGLEMKHTIILYAIAFGTGILFTSARRYFWNRWFLYGGLVAFLLILPNLLWQAYNGFPSLEFYRNATLYKNAPSSPLQVLAGQLFIIGPGTLPLVCLGLWYLFADREGKKYRAFGWGYVILLVIMIVGESSRPDRIMSIYTLIFAAGAVALERYAAAVRKRWPVLLVTLLLVISGGLAAPISVPLLPPATLVRYLSAIGFSLNIERGKSARLPQWFADRFGWRNLAETVGRVYRSLPPEQQHNCVILTGSYGQAGACELYSSEYPLPPVYSVHNSYALWGPPPDSVSTYIIVLIPRKDFESHFASVTAADTTSCEYCMNYESAIPIYVAWGPKEPVSSIWRKARHFE